MKLESSEARRRAATIGLAVVALTVGAVPVGLAAEVPVFDAATNSDVVLPDRVDAGDDLGLLAIPYDSLGLLIAPALNQQHTLGDDEFEVWACGDVAPLSEVIDDLEQNVVPYFQAHSRGRYRPVFVPGGSASEEDCNTGYVSDNAVGGTDGALIVANTSGGFGGPGGLICNTYEPCGPATFPESNRQAYVGANTAFHTVVVHELGHTLNWPHTSTGVTGSPYDVVNDVMSGNLGAGENSWGGTFDSPYASAVINRYAAGWIDTDEVLIVPPAGGSVGLSTFLGSGMQMAVIKDGGSYYTFGARRTSEHDPIPVAWEGVEVHKVTLCETCVYDLGYRSVAPEPSTVVDGYDREVYSNPLPHVIAVGETRQVGGVDVTVTGSSATGFTVSFGLGAGPLFTDTGDSVFENDIEWLATSGITRGCNPPANDRFCPDQAVTRGQMAAFLHRALPDLTPGIPATFDDDNSSVFEDDIEWLASVGVTRGCNPPTNDRFCPDEPVTRGQMAAFLQRALPDLTPGSPATFDDDNNSVFEDDIEWLASVGVTRGCNPPANDRFCPDEPVTRGQMAAFLQRALTG